MDPTVESGAGSSGRTPTWWVFAAYLATMGAATLWASLASKFVPFPLGDWIAVGAAAAAAVAFAVFVVVDPSFRPDSPYFQALLKRQPGLADTKTRLGAAAALAFLLTFVGVQRGLLDWWTQAQGSSGERVLTIAHWSHRGRSGCSGYSLREAPLLLHPAICTYGLQGLDTPGAPIRVFGPNSAVGVDVSWFEVAPASDRGPMTPAGH